jgi:hypothetical protein
MQDILEGLSESQPAAYSPVFLSEDSSTLKVGVEIVLSAPLARRFFHGRRAARTPFSNDRMGWRRRVTKACRMNDLHQECIPAALRLLERLRKAARDNENPSTAELQAERIYGLRPVNRLGDLIKDKYNGTRYDIERPYCGHGVYRWRLHEPARAGHPKDPKQTVLRLDEAPTTKGNESDFMCRRREEQAQATPLFAGTVRP